MNSQRLTSKLRELANHLNDFYLGYRQCSELCRWDKLSSYLIELSIIKLNMAYELKNHYTYLNKLPITEEAAGPVHQTLLNLKNMINQSSLDTLLTEIYCGENFLYRFYLEFLQEDIPIETKEFLSHQLTKIEGILNELYSKSSL